MLYAKGVFINKSFDALNVNRPDLVGEVHQEYVAADADVIETNDGTPPERFAPDLESRGATLIGLNRAVGPAPMLDTIERMAAVTTRTLSAQPNAGQPRDVEGRNIYLCSPEYMASYARRFIQHNVRLVGGCCGTTPEHIRQMKTSAGRRRRRDLERFEQFLKRIAQARLPVVAGVLPFESARHAEYIANEVPGAAVTEALLNRIRRADEAGAAVAEGVAIAREIAGELKRCVQGVQISTQSGDIEAAWQSSMDFIDGAEV